MSSNSSLLRYSCYASLNIQVTSNLAVTAPFKLVVPLSTGMILSVWSEISTGIKFDGCTQANLADLNLAVW